MEINLSRFGISVNGLLARQRQQPFHSIYVPQATATSFAWEAFSQAAFPIPAKGLLFWTLPGGARTLPEHTVCFSIVCNHAYDVPPRHTGFQSDSTSGRAAIWTRRLRGGKAGLISPGQDYRFCSLSKSCALSAAVFTRIQLSKGGSCVTPSSRG